MKTFICVFLDHLRVRFFFLWILFTWQQIRHSQKFYTRHYNVSQNCAMKMHFQVLLVAIRLERIGRKQSKKQNSDSEFVLFVKACFEELSFSVPQLVHFSNTFLCSRYCSSGTFGSIQTFTENIFNSSENFWHCQHGSVWQQTL